MKKTKQHYLQTICFLLMIVIGIFALSSVNAWAAETKTYGDFKYCYNEEYEGIEILKYKGSAKTVKIPEAIEGIPVKAIGESCFEKRGMWSQNKTLKRVTIPESVVVIKEYAFHECVALKSVNLPKNLQQIGESAFGWCKSLKSIKIPESIDVLPEGCFALTGLREVFIPKNIKKIDDGAFSLCGDLKKVTFEKNSKLESIGWQAFDTCDNLTSIKIPSNVKVLEQEAFRFCDQLKKVTFEKNSKLKEVGYGCFQYCDNLTTIVIPRNVKSIDKYAFERNCKLKTVIFKGKTPKIHTGAFNSVNPDLKFKVPKKYKSKYTKLLKGKKWYKDTMKIVAQ